MTCTGAGSKGDRDIAACERRRFLARGLGLVAVAAVHPVLASPALRPEERAPQVTVERDGGVFHVQAVADVPVPAAIAFATLTDYDRLGEFIPDLASSRTLQRAGATALVEQRGRAAFGPFEQQFTLRLTVEEAMGRRVLATLAGGDFKRFDARYELAELPGGTTRIEYRATLQPEGGVPPLVGLSVMRGMIRRQFAAMVGEIVRRA